jgi:toxin ParE1/3/4
MKRLRVLWNKPAKVDLANLLENIEQGSGSIEIALRYIDRLEPRCLRIGDVPGVGRMREDLGPGLRSVAFERSAIIFYVVEVDHVLITNIFRRGRDFEAILRGDTQSGEDG